MESPDKSGSRSKKASVPSTPDAKESLQTFKSSVYQFDTCQSDLKYKPSTQGISQLENEELATIPPLGAFRIENSVAVSPSHICYLQGNLIHTTRGDLINIHNSPILDMAIHPHYNLLATIGADNTLIVTDLNSNYATRFINKLRDPISRVFWRRSLSKMIITISDRQVELWELDEYSISIPKWYKLIIFEQKVIELDFSSISPDILAVSMDKGLVKVIDIKTDSEIYAGNPHTFNLKLYGPYTSVKIVYDKYLLTSGKSQNEFCIFSLETRTKCHTLTLSYNSQKLITLFSPNNSPLLVISDTASNLMCLVSFELQGSELKFSGIIDFTMIGPAQFITQKGSNLIAVNSGKVISYNLTCPSNPYSIKLLEDSELTEREDDKSDTTTTYSDSLSKLLSQDMESFTSSINNLTSLNWVKDAVENSVRDKRPYLDASIINSLTETARSYIKSTILPAFDTGLKHVYDQTLKAFTTTMKELSERSQYISNQYCSSLNSMNGASDSLQYIVESMGSSIEADSELLTDLENALEDKLMLFNNIKEYKTQYVIQPIEKTDVIKQHLLNSEFTAALLEAKKVNKLGKVLCYINPRALYSHSNIPTEFSFMILQYLLTSLPSNTVPEALLWIETILTSSDFTKHEELSGQVLDLLMSSSKKDSKIKEIKEKYLRSLYERS